MSVRVLIIADSEEEIDALPADLVFRADLAVVREPWGETKVIKSRKRTAYGSLEEAIKGEHVL